MSRGVGVTSWFVGPFHELAFLESGAGTYEPEPTPVLGIDETRARTVRWVLQEAGWRRCDPWLTSFVDADPQRQGPLLGLAPGRSGSRVTAWLAQQSDTFRAAIEVVDRFPVVGAPTAVSIYPGEIYKPPRTWTEKYFNLQQYRVHDDGGHFPPLEVPDIYVDDVRTFFRQFR